jgi:SAM-dependent methyltransferase
MSVERLHFGLGEMPSDAMLSADQLARYALLRSICRGRRVLDVACGEGYGASLLAQWGAASVTAVDISPEAIAKAMEILPANNVTYLVGDVCDLKNALPDESRFDVICSFETIQRVDDPEAFLRALAVLRSDSSVVAISVPNGDLSPNEEDKPSPKRRYTLATFKQATEAALGPGANWFFGIPIQGYTLLPEITSTPVNTGSRLSLDGKDVGGLHLLPPQPNLNKSNENALSWVGIWGSLPNDASAALSMNGFLESWIAHGSFVEEIDRKDKEIASKNGLLDRQRANNKRLEITIAEQRRIALGDRKRISELESLIASGINIRRDPRATPLPAATAPQVVQTFWHGNVIGPYQLVCLRSFADYGHQVEIFSYDSHLNLPDWIERRDAAEILPHDKVLRPLDGRFAIHANLFRYALLHQRGGWWIDPDVILLKPDLPAADVFFAGIDVFGMTSTGLLRFPKGHSIVKAGLEKTLFLGDSIADWEASGAMLLTDLIQQKGLGSDLRSREPLGPISWFDVPALFSPSHREHLEQLCKSAQVLQFHDDVWRRSGVPQRLGPPEGSLLDALFQQHDATTWFPERMNFDEANRWINHMYQCVGVRQKLSSPIPAG